MNKNLETPQIAIQIQKKTLIKTKAINCKILKMNKIKFHSIQYQAVKLFSLIYLIKTNKIQYQKMIVPL